MARKLSAKSYQKKISNEITRLYGIHARGFQIDILNIGPLYRMAEHGHAQGIDLETAVKAAIKRYCVTPDGSVMTLEVV